MLFLNTKVLACLSVISTSMASAQAFQPFHMSTDPGPILGETGFESTLKYCPESLDTDLFPIELLEIHPNPPVIGDYVSIYLFGTFQKNITEDATFEWTATNTYNQQSGVTKFCDTMITLEQPDPARDQQCPPEKGWAMIHIYRKVSWLVAEGSYKVKFDANTKEGERIYCLQGEFELKYPEINWDL